MARCGCTPKCSCVFNDGVCTSVTLTVTPEGCGENSFTYTVNVLTDEQTVFCGANGLEARLTTLDTNTVDLSGLGTAGSPLEARVIRTADGDVPGGLGQGNLIKELPGVGGGIYVSCEDIQDCVGAAIDVITTDCLDYDDATNTISILICGEPNGLECVPAGDAACPTGGLAVFPSTDPFNSLAFGTDDRLYKAASAIIPGECMVFTGSGTAGDPFVITPLIAPEQNGVECVPGQGLLVTPSADLGNGLVFGGDTRLWINRCPLVVAGSQVLVGNAGPCFEFVGGNDCVTPMVATLRLSDDPCQGLSCGNDGLFVQIDDTNLPVNVTQTINFPPAGPFNGNTPLDPTGAGVVLFENCLQMTNPSPCRTLLIYASLNATLESGRTSGAPRFTIDSQPAGPGDPWFAVIQVGQSNPSPPSRQTASGFWSGNPFFQPPGTTRTWCFRLTYNSIDPGQPSVNARLFSGTLLATLLSNWAD